MKKVLSVTVLLFMALFACFASIEDFDFKLWGGDSLYKEAYFDPYAYKTAVEVVNFLDGKYEKMYLRALVSDNALADTKYEYKDFYIENNGTTLYAWAKVAFDIDFLKISFNNGSLPKLEAQSVLKFYYNTFWNIFSGSTLYGIDGSYLFAEEFNFADKVSARVGIHHLSGHWGDEALEKFESQNKVSVGDKRKTLTDKSTEKEYTYFGPVQYVRDNELLLSIDCNLPEGFRPYAQFATPLKTAWVRPFIHLPDNMERTIAKLLYGAGFPALDEDRQQTYNGNYGINGVDDLISGNEKSDSYHAYRINFGLDWDKSFKKFGLYAGFDGQFNQDYQTKDQIEGYKSTNPWEFEYTIGAGIEFYNLLRDKNVYVEASFKSGRLPMLNYFYEHTEMIFIGFGIR